MGIAWTLTTPPVRRKGFLGKIKTMIAHLDDKSIYSDLCKQCRPNNCSQQYCQMSNNAFCGPRCGYSGCGLVGCNNMATTPSFQRVVMCGPATWLPNYAPPLNNYSVTVSQNCCNSYCGQC